MVMPISPVRRPCANLRTHFLVVNMAPLGADALSFPTGEIFESDDDTDDEGDKASLSLALTKSEGFHNRNLNNMAPVASNPSAPANMPAWFLSSNKFTPECCPSTYSSSTGCACLNPQQINYLNQTI